VKRSFGHRERKASIDELRDLNTALGNIFQKSEISSDELNPRIRHSQARFRLSHCDTIREQARLLYSALSTDSIWHCNCQEHEGALILRWHLQDFYKPENLLLGLKRGSEWRSLQLAVESEKSSASGASAPGTLSTSSTPRAIPPLPAKPSKLRKIFKLSQATPQPHLIGEFTTQRNSVCFANLNQLPHQSICRFCQQSSSYPVFAASRILHPQNVVV
jgi:hypothetical protein